MDLGNILFGSHQGLARYKDEPITALLSAILPNVYVVAGIIVFLYLIFGGFLIIAGGGESKQMEQGKTVITQAVVGLLIIFTSYWLIQIIQIVTGLKILNANL